MDLWDNKVGDAGAIALATALEAQGDDGAGGSERRGGGLTELHLCWNHVGDAGAVALAKSLRKNRRLTRLCLWDNSIGAARRDPMHQPPPPPTPPFAPASPLDLEPRAQGMRAATLLRRPSKKTLRSPSRT